MAIPVLIIGRSGSGKTYSLKGFNDFSDSIGVISVEKARLPFKSSIKVARIPKYEDSPKAEYCAQCGSLLMQTPGHRQKRFCTNRCRRLWWKEHPESMDRKAYSPYTCQHCGKAFLQYGSRQRKFCSRKCYLTNRYEHTDAPDAE